MRSSAALHALCARANTNRIDFAICRQARSRENQAARTRARPGMEGVTGPLPASRQIPAVGPPAAKAGPEALPAPAATRVVLLSSPKAGATLTAANADLSSCTAMLVAEVSAAERLAEGAKNALAAAEAEVIVIINIYIYSITINHIDGSHVGY